MHVGAKQLPTQHISIRVPWHDSGWNGTVCQHPEKNIACRALRNIAEKKDDAKEAKIKGCKFSDLQDDERPPCIGENGKFMAPFRIKTTKIHPYAKWKSPHPLVRHFRPTTYELDPYTAECVPYRWMNLIESEKIINQLKLGFNQELEPTDLKKKSTWIQERNNHLVMLDTFFSAIKPNESLCFFYAKDTPLSSSPKRTIIGVGLVESVGNENEYEYTPSYQSFKSLIWERNITHSIRPEFKKGFLFPYNNILKRAEKQGFNPEEYVAFAPDDAFNNFSWGTEHVSDDQAISTILICLRALEKIIILCPEDKPKLKLAVDWLTEQLNRLWKMRGAFPGFGSVLTAFLGENGALIAHDIATFNDNASAHDFDPWKLFDKYIKNSGPIPDSFNKLIEEGYLGVWEDMPPERKELLKLLSRFSISASQAERFFDPGSRPTKILDNELISNPYLLYEEDRYSIDPISVTTVDRGMIPLQSIKDAFPLPNGTKFPGILDPRRVLALMVHILEEATNKGHTLLPLNSIIEEFKELPLDTDCPLRFDAISSFRNKLGQNILEVEMENDDVGFQLTRLNKISKLIRKTVMSRIRAKPIRGSENYNFRAKVDETLEKYPEDEEAIKIENLAREEKASALETLFKSKLSVLVGSAGTGKTTLLKMLCSLKEVSSGEILLLAPTGKSKVQLETKTQIGDALTIAHFLMITGQRYVPETGWYTPNQSPDQCEKYKTVIIDECSMVTEDQLASIFDALSGVERYVLVGDPQQLPPIGSGRPFVDIINEVKPANIEFSFPCVKNGYAELTIPRRQKGKSRIDVHLAKWFGSSSDSAIDSVWDMVESNTNKELIFEDWKDSDELQEKLLKYLMKELNLSGTNDESGFEASLGGEPFRDSARMHFFQESNKEKLKVEDWQIISAVRGEGHGVEMLNRLIQTKFRKSWLDTANSSGKKKINGPLGPQGIIYGDKVINLKNKSNRRLYPKGQSYVANGEIGIVVGDYNSDCNPQELLKVEFSSQLNHRYIYWLNEFNGEGLPPLELAYALTVHKTQGSEFETTFVILPNPCWILTRELLYTSLTRHKGRIVIFHQGDLSELRKLTSLSHSEISSRLTNIFSKPSLIPLEVNSETELFEGRFIHKTKRDDIVRSNSEVIIADTLLDNFINDYKYESRYPLDNGRSVYPNFRFYDADSDTKYFWEHLSFQFEQKNPTYWEQKLADYRDSGILPRIEGGGDNGTLIITRDKENVGVTGSEISELLSEVLYI